MVYVIFIIIVEIQIRLEYKEENIALQYSYQMRMHLIMRPRAPQFIIIEFSEKIKNKQGKGDVFNGKMCDHGCLHPLVLYKLSAVT